MLIPMADAPRWHADRNGHNCVAIVHGQNELTWSELERNANRRARAFMELGVARGACGGSAKAGNFAWRGDRRVARHG